MRDPNVHNWWRGRDGNRIFPFPLRRGEERREDNVFRWTTEETEGRGEGSHSHSTSIRNTNGPAECELHVSLADPQANFTSKANPPSGPPPPPPGFDVKVGRRFLRFRRTGVRWVLRHPPGRGGGPPDHDPAGGGEGRRGRRIGEEEGGVGGWGRKKEEWGGGRRRREERRVEGGEEEGDRRGRGGVGAAWEPQVEEVQFESEVSPTPHREPRSGATPPRGRSY